MSSIPSPFPFLKFAAASPGTAVLGGTVAGATVLASTTYYVDLNWTDAAHYQSVQVDWDATIILTSIQVEISDYSSDVSAINSTSTRQWIPVDPPGSYVPVVGGVATVSIVAVAGGTQGGCVYDLSSTGTLRRRLKIVVGGTGGNANATAHAKG